MEPEEKVHSDAVNRVWRIIMKYCRPYPWYTKKGVVPMRCTPSRVELASGKTIMSNRKIIYDSWDSAQRAAQEIFQVTGLRTRAYTCHRSTTKKHKHLTTDEEWMKKHAKAAGDG